MKNRKKAKGFTLIELLVVVAIIGILASVGVVAYNGYTESAKKAGVASNHANIMKVIGAELAKCNIDSYVFKTADTATDANSLNCDNKGTEAADRATKYFTAKAEQYKNPYGGAVMGAVDAAPAVGNTTLAQTTSTVTVKSCKTKDATCPAAEILTGTVSID